MLRYDKEEMSRCLSEELVECVELSTTVLWTEGEELDQLVELLLLLVLRNMGSGDVVSDVEVEAETETTS